MSVRKDRELNRRCRWDNCAECFWFPQQQPLHLGLQIARQRRFSLVVELLWPDPLRTSLCNFHKFINAVLHAAAFGHLMVKTKDRRLRLAEIAQTSNIYPQPFTSRVSTSARRSIPHTTVHTVSSTMMLDDFSQCTTR